MAPLKKTPGVIYEEDDVDPSKDKDHSEDFSPYRNYIPVCNAFTAMGIPFAAYGVKEKFTKAYLNAGAVCFPGLHYVDLIKQLSRYDWGFCGCPIKQPQWDRAMPNKLFEYLAAGMPVLVYNAAEAGEFVRQHEIGVVVENLKDVQEIYDQHEKYRENVLLKRRKWIMESQVDKIIGLYRKVLGY